nr:basic proline-rich protein-like [Pelodiscus sinensis]|eukprot:XP_025040083.1 basic proline-rich protein-like [Pelodiscus sinensis]
MGKTAPVSLPAGGLVLNQLVLYMLWHQLNTLRPAPVSWPSSRGQPWSSPGQNCAGSPQGSCVSPGGEGQGLVCMCSQVWTSHLQAPQTPGWCRESGMECVGAPSSATSEALQRLLDGAGNLAWSALVRLPPPPPGPAETPGWCRESGMERVGAPSSATSEALQRLLDGAGNLAWSALVRPPPPPPGPADSWMVQGIWHGARWCAFLRHLQAPQRLLDGAGNLAWSALVRLPPPPPGPADSWMVQGIRHGARWCAFLRHLQAPQTPGWCRESGMERVGAPSSATSRPCRLLDGAGNPAWSALVRLPPPPPGPDPTGSPFPPPQGLCETPPDREAVLGDPVPGSRPPRGAPAPQPSRVRAGGGVSRGAGG